MRPTVTEWAITWPRPTGRHNQGSPGEVLISLRILWVAIHRPGRVSVEGGIRDVSHRVGGVNPSPMKRLNLHILQLSQIHQNKAQTDGIGFYKKEDECLLGRGRS
jgi:hypothetical protein